MITKISGVVDSINKSAVIVENAGVYYSVLMPPVMLDELSRTHGKGDSVLLYTYYYIEGGVGVGNLFPRLIGFFSEDDRSFFEIFTTVKGLGEKKALQSLTVPVSNVANAVEQGDLISLKHLPGIGGRMAEKIVAELRGKLSRFTTGVVPKTAAAEGQISTAFEQQAVNVLISQLGYRRIEAEQLIQKAIAATPDIDTVEELIQTVFQQNISAENA
ncbi:Holliday junction branch migration protein RuvA [candidate division KSB1 bacterium]